MTDDEFYDEIFCPYVKETMLWNETRREDGVTLPSDNATCLPLDILESILNNPGQLTEASNAGLRSRANRVLVFTRWLENRLDDPAPQSNSIPQHMTSRAIRLIFAVYSLEYRYTAISTGPTVNAWPEGLPYGEYCTPVDGTPKLVSTIINGPTALKYQQKWSDCLNSWESDPWLSEQYTDDPEKYESDLRWLTTTWPSNPGHRWPSRPGRLILDGLQNANSIANDVAERFLERGSPWQAARSLTPQGLSRFEKTGTVFAFIFAGLLPIMLFLAGFGNLARWWAAVTIVVVLAVAACVSRRYLPLGILRMPAACGVGTTLLLTLTANWWVNQRSWQLGAALLLVAALYLVLEIHQHGTTWMKALGRGLGLTFSGALIAAVLSIAVLGFVAPRIVDKGECLGGWWDGSPWQALPLSTTPLPLSTTPVPADTDSTHDLQTDRVADSCAKSLRASEAAAPARTLLLMTGWSLAFGLGAQILWDDRPVTAPLGRLRRTRGGTE